MASNPLDLSLEALQALVLTAQKKADNPLEGRFFLRVIDKFYEHLNGRLDHYQKTTLIDDFGKQAVMRIPKYNGFYNEPNYFAFEGEKRVGNGIYWNLHEPLPYKPEEGDWPTIEKLLKHIFKDQYEMGLDWFQLVLTQPKQPLPIPCLVSGEQETGKSSLLRLIQYLIPGNTASISISDFAESFNAHFCTKHVVLIDETETEGVHSPKSISSKLKRWVTQETVIRNEKNQPRAEVPFYGKLVVCSNHEDNFIQVEEEDTRYWILKVGNPGKKDPDFFVKLKAECKHFVFFLQHRTMETSVKQGRLWFSTSQIKTNAFNQAVESGRSTIYHDLKELILDDLDRREEAEGWFTPTQLREMLGNNRYGFGHIKKMIKRHWGKDVIQTRVRGISQRVYHFTRAELTQEVKQEKRKPDLTDTNVNILW